MSMAFLSLVPRLLSENDCGHNQASYNCKLSDVFNNLIDLCQWVMTIAGKSIAQTSLFDIFLTKFPC